MNRVTCKWHWLTTVVTVMVLMLSSASAFALNFAQHPAYTRSPYFSGAPIYQPYSYPYVGRPFPYYAGPGGLQGHYSGYAKPRIYMRARVNRYGDYRFDIKLRGVSQYDLVKAWWLLQQYGNQ